MEYSMMVWSQWVWPWHDCWCQKMGWFEFFLWLIIFWDFCTQQSLEFTLCKCWSWVCNQIERSVMRPVMVVSWETSGRNTWLIRRMNRDQSQTVWSWQKDYRYPEKLFWLAEKHLIMHTILNLKADGQKKPTFYSTSASQERSHQNCTVKDWRNVAGLINLDLHKWKGQDLLGALRTHGPNLIL